MFSGLPPKADIKRRDWHGRLVPIVLQKSPSRLCEIEICNNRIGASVLLNRCCSFVPDLESMFRDQMQKILLQHNLPRGDIGSAANSPGEMQSAPDQKLICTYGLAADQGPTRYERVRSLALILQWYSPSHGSRGSYV